MKLLLDQGLPRSAAKLLKAHKIETIHVGEIGLWAAEDIKIIQKAKEINCVVVTLDADFHSLLAFSNAPFTFVAKILKNKLIERTILTGILKAIAN